MEGPPKGKGRNHALECLDEVEGVILTLLEGGGAGWLRGWVICS